MPVKLISGCKWLFLIIFLVVLLTSCANINSVKWQQSTLYFGLSSKDGGLVQIDQWQEFVDSEITSRFPDGFTVISANGQWLEDNGETIKEPSRVVIIIHTTDKETSKNIAEIREKYKLRFNQQSVLLTTQPLKVDF